MYIVGVMMVVIVGLFVFFGLLIIVSVKDVMLFVFMDWLNENLDNQDVFVFDICLLFVKLGQEDYLKVYILGVVWSEYLGYWCIICGEVFGVLLLVEKMEVFLLDLGVYEGWMVVIVFVGVFDFDFGVVMWIYWMFKYFGYDKVVIFDGGYVVWVVVGY